MRIFFSVGEPSGAIHGANLIRSLQRLDPATSCFGFGGERMEQAGCDIVYPLCEHAVMGVSQVLPGIATFASLIARADRLLRRRRPDAVVLIDYPGFNWWIARRAHAQGIPVYYFVPPQLWAWAGWRIKKVRRWVDHVLCTLPFEQKWYQERGVDAHYVGHPFFDDLPQQRLDQHFLDLHRDSAPRIGLLPGSRDQEVERNWSMLYRSAARIHQRRPDVRFLVACFKPHQQKLIDDYLRRHPPLPIETHVGRTPEILELATACITVSGSVSLELLWRAKPSVIVYRIGRLGLRLAKWFVKVRHMSLVNLLAGKELYPEFPATRCESAAISGEVLNWLNNPVAYSALRNELTALRDQVARPGACDEAARYIFDTLAAGHARRAA